MKKSDKSDGGGKRRQQASSSSAAASLQQHGLAAGSLTFASFTGGAALSPSPSPSPSPFPSDLVGSPVALDPNVALFLKQASKRDSTTRRKAIGSLLQLLQSNDDDAVAHAALGPYIHAYYMCSGDVDRSVRATASQLLLLLFRRCGKAIAPHLKRVCAPLWMARCDPAQPAKQAAAEAWTSVFPTKEKQTAAATAVSSELLAALCDAACVTPASAVERGMCEECVAEELVERSTVCALGALAAWFAEADMLSSKAVQALESPAAAMVARGDLLSKCFKQPHSVVAAAINFMISVISHAPQFLLSSSSSGTSQASPPPLLSLHVKTVTRLLADGGGSGGNSSLAHAALMCAGHLISSQPLAAALGSKVTSSVSAAMVACLRRLLKHDPHCARDVLLPCLDLIQEKGGGGACWTEGEWSRRLGVQILRSLADPPSPASPPSSSAAACLWEVLAYALCKSSLSQQDGEKLFAEAAAATSWAVIYNPTTPPAAAAAASAFQTFAATFGSFWRWVSAGASQLPAEYRSSLLQLFGSVLNKIVDELEQQQRHQDDAVPVDGVAAIGISEGVESIDVAAPSEPPPSSSAAHTACNIVSLLQSLYESMATIPDSSSVCTDFISAFLFGCISRINWSSSPSSSPLSSSPGRCAIITAAQPLLQLPSVLTRINGMMTLDLASQIANAVLQPPISSSSSADEDFDDASLSALAAVALHTLSAFSPETLLAKLIAVVPSSSSSSSSSSFLPASPPLLLSASLLQSCVRVWGSASPAITALVAAYCLPALHSIGVSLSDSASIISSSTSQKAMLCSRVLPHKTVSAINLIIGTHACRNQSASHDSSTVELQDSTSAWACLYSCICASVEHAILAERSSILDVVSHLLPQLASLGPSLAPSTIDALSDALHTSLLQAGDACAGVRMCKQSLKGCLQPSLLPGRPSSFDGKRSSAILQIYSRTLASGRDRASVFAWAVVGAMYHGNDDDDGFVHRFSDADAFSLSFQREVFDCGRLVIESVQLLSDVLFSDTHPQDCADIDWSTVSISSSCGGETAAAAACEALLMIMDALAWSHGTVLTTGSKHPEAIAGVNFDGSSWAKSTSYRCACSVIVQVLYWSSGSSAAAVKCLAASAISMGCSFSNRDPENISLKPMYMNMLACRSVSSLLLHACDVTDSSHPLHVIASDAVELIASHVVQQVRAVASSSPLSQHSSLLFVAAAIASRAGYLLRGSTAVAAASLCTAAVDMLHSSPPLPSHASAFAWQLLASCIGDSGSSSSSSSSHTVSLSQTIFLINACLSHISLYQSSDAEVQPSHRNFSSFAPFPYPMVLPLPEHCTLPLHVAAATALASLLKLPVLTAYLREHHESLPSSSPPTVTGAEIASAFASAARVVGQQLQICTAQILSIAPSAAGGGGGDSAVSGDGSIGAAVDMTIALLHTVPPLVELSEQPLAGRSLAELLQPAHSSSIDILCMLHALPSLPPPPPCIVADFALLDVAVETSRWLPSDFEADAVTEADPAAGADADDDSCFIMADTIRLLLLPRTRLFRAASLAVRAQPRGRVGEGEGLVGRLCRVLRGGKGDSSDVMCIGVCASAAGLLRMMLATGSAHLKDVDWLMLDGAAGDAAARVLPVQLCDALQGLQHQQQHEQQQQHQQHHRHRNQQSYVSLHLFVRQLAVWSVVLDWIHVTPPGGTRAPIIKWLEDTGLVQQLLSFISFSSIAFTGSDKSSTCRLVDSADSTPLPPVSLLELAHAQPQQALGNATALLTRVLRLLPAASRAWFNALDSSAAAALERFVSQRVSPVLVDECLQECRTASPPADLRLLARTNTREVVAVFSQDEARLEVVVALPASFPLRVPTSTGTKVGGIPEKTWRRYMLNMHSVLLLCNGSVLDAVLLWRINVQKAFEGVEPCPICYSVIDTHNQSLPSQACRTCHHKFHSSCLSHWFTQSQGSSCPYCRSKW